MGQCMSRKAAGAFAASAAASQNRPHNIKNNKIYQSPDDVVNIKEPMRKTVYNSSTKGIATSFGFKRRPVTAPSIASNASAARRLAHADYIDNNGNENEDDMDQLTLNIVPSGRSTPKLQPPKKDPNAATRINRFGFRQPPADRMNKVADLNSRVAADFGSNNNVVKPHHHHELQQNQQIRITTATTPTIQNKYRSNTITDNNRNKLTGKVPSSTNVQIGKFTLQTAQLPRPQSVLVLETKMAKTLANNNVKMGGEHYKQGLEDNVSSKDGSSTEDSGVGSHHTGDETEDFCHGNKNLYRSKPRNLDVMLNGNTFDLRDLDDSFETSPLPQLPSAFKSATENRNRSLFQNTQNLGLVRERTLEYQRQIERDNRRTISVTSSEGFSDNYGDEDKHSKNKCGNDKSFVKSSVTKSFLKPRVSDVKDSSSPVSSDEHEFTFGGEAMADEVSFSMSSSDESRDRDFSLNRTAIRSSMLLQNLTLETLSPRHDFKNVLLSIEDPNSVLLQDETSPVDESLISFTESDEILKRKMSKSFSISKDVNEKLTPPSPGTPTHASNSLSLSEGKDDFLIDDEIADQPALVFEETTITNHSNKDLFSTSASFNISDGGNTLIESSTPKPRRKKINGFEGSPLVVKNKKFLNSRTVSLDTLSPCESIASDDLMMDFDYSQSSGMDDCDRLEKICNGLLPLNETVIITSLEDDTKNNESLRDWSALLSGIGDRTSKCASRTRLLKSSRTGTPNSVPPDSPSSLDSRLNGRTKVSTTNSPLRFSRFTPMPSAGYDSDDSVRVDRATHQAIKQDMVSVKNMLFRLKRLLDEQTDEDILMKSETHNPFESERSSVNGLFIGDCLNDIDEEFRNNGRTELAELRRQVLFLQGQLEDKERAVTSLQEQMIKLASDNYVSNSAPASTIADESTVCNAATQTDRIRPISAGPSLLNGSQVDSSASSLVSLNEVSRKSRTSIPTDPSSVSHRKPPSKSWRKTTASNTTPSLISRRTSSRSRIPSTSIIS